MSKRKRFNIAPYVESRNVADLEDVTGNVYKSIVVVSKRSNQVAANLKEELHAKLREFASSSDTLEEIHENKEQIEISKYYEKMPHPTLLALEEFTEDKLFYKKGTSNHQRGGGKKYLRKKR